MSQQINFVKPKLDPIIPEIGIHENVPFEEYARWNCFSKSMAKHVLRSHAHLDANVKHRTTTKSLKLGSLIDCLVLEPHLYASQYVEQPATYPAIVKKVEVQKPWSNNATFCKQYNLDVAFTGKTTVNAKMLSDARACQVALNKNEEIRNIIDDGKKQISLVWECPHTGILCKARFDLLGSQYKAITDLKSAENGSQEEFSNASRKFGYPMQGGTYTEAYYILAKKKFGFTNIVVETGNVKIMQPATSYFEFLYEDPLLKLGRLEFRRACEMILKYSFEDGIKGYPERPQMVTFPMWAVIQEAAHHGEEGAEIVRELQNRRG